MKNYSSTDHSNANKQANQLNFDTVKFDEMLESYLPPKIEILNDHSEFSTLNYPSYFMTFIVEECNKIKKHHDVQLKEIESKLNNFINDKERELFSKKFKRLLKKYGNTKAFANFK